MARKSLRYQSGNQNPHIEEQTTQWPKDKVQKDKRHTKHTHKTTDRATRTPLKTGGELMCSQLVITVIFSACPIVQCRDDSTSRDTRLLSHIYNSFVLIYYGRSPKNLKNEPSFTKFG